MAVTNPTAVAFCNQRVRVAADRVLQAYYFALLVIDEWNTVEMAPGTTLAAGIPNSGSEEVVDGSETDGRSRIYGDDVSNIVNRCIELRDWVEGGAVLIAAGRKGTLDKVAVNPQN